MSLVALLADELQLTIDALEQVLADTWTEAIRQEVSRANAGCKRIAESWSGSPIDYHASCYYRDFEPAPPGGQFNTEWGLSGFGFANSNGWAPRSYDDVWNDLVERGQSPDIDRLVPISEVCKTAFREYKARVLSILSAALTEPDGYLEQVRQRIEGLEVYSERELLESAFPRGQVLTRDPTANMRFKNAPHQIIAAKVGAIESTEFMCRALIDEAQHAADHMRLLERRGVRAARATGTTVFVGHGGSPLWRELKDFIQDRLHLQCDEFNRVPVAGVTTVARLSQMLDDAAIAFLVMTSEDETAEGEHRARQNVVHEVGLFQGRLGFDKAIVLLESGCTEFSNIEGLGQIRFPTGNIAAKFEDVRAVLEHHGLVAAPRPAAGSPGNRPATQGAGTQPTGS